MLKKGDGRVLLRAVQRGASLAIGYELSPDAYQLGIEHLETASGVLGFSKDMKRRIKLYHGDARDANPLDFDITTLFLLPEGLAILAPWLKDLWKKSQSRGKHFANPQITIDSTSSKEETHAVLSPAVVSQGWALPLENHSTASCAITSAVAASTEGADTLSLVKKEVIPLTGTAIYLYR